MSKTPFEKSQNSDGELLVEYRFDYQKAKPNRFATYSGKQRTVVVIGERGRASEEGIPRLCLGTRVRG
jgi:hypothetical protein